MNECPNKGAACFCTGACRGEKSNSKAYVWTSDDEKKKRRKIWQERIKTKVKE